jgi:hypothetical protein
MLPTRRLIRVFERALGIRIGNVINLFDVQASAGEAISSQDAARQQVVALNLLAELSNDRERQVTGHSAPRYGLLWWAAPDGDAELTAVVANADGVITLTSPPTATLHRLDRVGLAQLAGLAPHQDVGFTQLRAGRQSQVTGMQRIVNEIMRHARKIAKYNQHQPRSRVTLDLESLQALIQEQLDEREAAAQIVAASLGRAMPDGHDVYLLIEPDAPTPCLIPGPAGRGATVIEAAMRGPSPRAYVAIGSPSHVVPASPAQQGIESRAALWTALFAEVFGVTEVTPSTGRHTHLNDAIAELLGHMFNEIWLVDSDIMPSTNP